MLDAHNAAFVQAGVSISLAACDATGLPTICRGLGCKLIGDELLVFVRRSQGEELLANVARAGLVANVFSLPSTNETLQLKGREARVAEFDRADIPVIERHIADFVAQIAPLGLSAEVAKTLFAYDTGDLACVRYTPCAVYVQTPGPRAGEVLNAQP